MITSLRRWHRRLLTAIAIGLPLLAAAALLQRPDRPVASPSSDPLFVAAGYHQASPPDLQPLIHQTKRVDATTIDLELSRHPGGQLWLKITPERELPVSDPLIVWTPANPQPKDLSNATVIGSLSGLGSRGWWLPAAMQGGGILLVSNNKTHTLIRIPHPPSRPARART